MKALYLAANILGIDPDARGGKAALARLLRVTPVSVGQWFTKNPKAHAQPSLKMAKELQRLTGDQIKWIWIRPDIAREVGLIK